jgi:2-(1,2-epoxy-1,2-dihydrophenyl)acetyl-CoA isomerase|tara:strand:+ start:1015 stop:1809 length:795 start_codon:yes stop_codon:yes gene_type:complete
MSELIKFEVNKNSVAILTLNDPDRLNALSLKMISEIHDKIKDINSGDTKARCLVITGSGKGFCSGANLFDNKIGSDFSKLDMGVALDSHYHPMLNDLKNLIIPIITAVNGPAAGAGCSLAIFGDLVYAAKSSYFYQAFKFIGLVPDASSTYVLPRKIGMARAMEFAMLGEKVSADKALTWGLINDVFENNTFMDEVMKIATEIAEGPTVAYSLMRKLFWDSLSNDFQGQLNAESAAQSVAGKTEDCFNGVMAFAQKKKPDFKGK